VDQEWNSANVLAIVDGPSANGSPGEEHGGSSFAIRAASSMSTRSAASALIRQRYEWRGYESNGLSASEEPNTTTFTAMSLDGARALGTISVRIDTPEAGLHCEAAYPEAVADLRRAGALACELGSLAVDGMSSKLVLCSLFHIAFIYATEARGARMLLAEVNPRHQTAYRVGLGFQQLGAERNCQRVGAPAVLLGIESEQASSQIARWGGTYKASGKSAGRSLYPYFFSPHEASGIAARIWGYGSAPGL